MLAKRSDASLLGALEAAEKLKDFPADLDLFIIPVLEHKDELVRRATLVACRSALNWRPFFENEPFVLVRQAWVARIMHHKGREAVPFALQQLADPDWRIRAEAVEGLLSFGKCGVRAALELLPEASESVRIGIARMVVQCDDEELLEQSFTVAQTR